MTWDIHRRQPPSLDDDPTVAGSFSFLVTNQPNTQQHHYVRLWNNATTRRHERYEKGRVYKVRPPFLSFFKFYFTHIFSFPFTTTLDTRLRVWDGCLQLDPYPRNPYRVYKPVLCANGRWMDRIIG